MNRIPLLTGSVTMRLARRHFPVALVILLAFGLGGASSFASDASLYLVDSTFGNPLTRIFQVDPATGAMVVRADLGTAHGPVFGMAAASGSVLYLAGTDNSPSNLCAGNVACLLLRVVMDPLGTTPSSLEVIGPILEDGAIVVGISGMSFRSDGKLYAVSQDTGGLYLLSPGTASASRICTVDLEVHGGDVTFDGSDRLWLWTNLGEGGGLYQLDPVTCHAQAFDIEPFLDMSGMAAVGHGATLRGASASMDTLYEIDPAIGLTGISAPFTLDGAPFDHSRGDLDSPFCEEDAACDDGNPCTRDACTPGGCSHAPMGECCLVDSDCGAAGPCAIPRCAENRCVSIPLAQDGGETCNPSPARPRPVAR